MFKKLIQEWRSDSSLWLSPEDCAKELEECLPPWTLLTEDTDTLPEGEGHVMTDHPSRDTHGIVSIDFLRTNHNYWIGRRWRYMCDIDLPARRIK